MMTLRSYNKRMDKFGSGKVKKSRRKFAIGGESSMWDPTYRDSETGIPGGTSAQKMDGLRNGYAKGGRVGRAEGGDLYTEEELAKMREQESPALVAPALDPDSGVTVGKADIPQTSLPREIWNKVKPDKLDENVGEPNFSLRTDPATLQQTDFPAKDRVGHPALPMLRRAATVQPDEEERAKTPIQTQKGVTTESRNFGTLGLAMTDPTDKPAAPGYTSDEEAGAGAKNKLLGHYGLRSETTRETSMPGGITKYKDASGKTLYANTTDTGGTKRGSVSTYESGPAAKENADRLTAAITARLASGAPEDLEAARQLAVTPAHRALIAEQDNLLGLRRRVAMGDPTAAFELQNRAERGKIAAQSQAAMMQELFKHQLSSQLTPYQQADLGLRATQQAQTEARATRAENFAQNTAMIEKYFGSDDLGKAAATRFHQRLADAMPHLKGDIAQLKPEQQNLLLGASKILDLYEADQKPGWVTSLFGAKPPQYNQLLDVMRGAKIQPNWFHGGELVTPYGKLAERNVDPGTWKTITQMVNDAQKSAPVAKK